MEFQEDKTQRFLEIFEANKALIRGSYGCIHLELWQDANENNVYYTYSLWNDKEDLEAYRESELFRKVWSQTKKLFSAKPQAYSVYQIAKIG